MGTKDSVDLVAEPGLMAKLKRDARSAGDVESWSREEVAETCSVGHEIRWKLEEKETEFACLPYDLQYRDEVGEIGFAVGQAFDVGDALGSLEAETKEVGRSSKPAFEHHSGREGAEGVVDLYRAELARVKLKKAPRWGFIRIEGRFPGGIGPTRGSGIDASLGCSYGCFTRERQGLRKSGHGVGWLIRGKPSKCPKGEVWGG